MIGLLAQNLSIPRILVGLGWTMNLDTELKQTQAARFTFFVQMQCQTRIPGIDRFSANGHSVISFMYLGISMPHYMR